MKPDASLAIVNIVLLLVLFFLTSGALIGASAVSEVSAPVSRDLLIQRLDGPTLEVGLDETIRLDGITVTGDEMIAALADQSRLFLLVDAEALAANLLDFLDDPVFDTIEVRLVTIDSVRAP
ncbi:MAG: biopolymer transporter ExbD [Loktanella sp.]|nr:biopolymer transporter ExbD [Loktanella sp.]